MDYKIEAPPWLSYRLDNIADSKFAPIAQLDRALPSEGRGRRFDSAQVRHFTFAS